MPPAAGVVGTVEVPAPGGPTRLIVFFGSATAAQAYVNDDHALREAVQEKRELALAAGDHVYVLAAAPRVTTAQR